MAELRIGEVIHYYSRAEVAALKLEAPLRLGDRVHVLGHTTDLMATVESMEIDRKQIDSAQPGDDVAIKITGRVREGDIVYRETVTPS